MPYTSNEAARRQAAYDMNLYKVAQNQPIGNKIGTAITNLFRNDKNEIKLSTTANYNNFKQATYSTPPANVPLPASANNDGMGALAMLGAIFFGFLIVFKILFK